jgi:hypothetical protein
MSPHQHERAAAVGLLVRRLVAYGETRRGRDKLFRLIGYTLRTLGSLPWWRGERASEHRVIHTEGREGEAW